jgi:hypothetical protein
VSSVKLTSIYGGQSKEHSLDISPVHWNGYCADCTRSKYQRVCKNRVPRELELSTCCTEVEYDKMFMEKAQRRSEDVQPSKAEKFSLASKLVRG